MKNKRYKKAQEIVKQNKVFTFFAVVLVIFLIINFIEGFVEKAERYDSIKNADYEETTVVEGETATAEGEAALIEEEQDNSSAVKKMFPRVKEKWRFYMVDVIILGVGVVFCYIMLRRERKKTKGELE